MKKIKLKVIRTTWHNKGLNDERVSIFFPKDRITWAYKDDINRVHRSIKITLPENNHYGGNFLAKDFKILKLKKI